MPACRRSRFGVARGVEQQIGDLRHGRDHRRDRPIRGLDGDQIAGGLHARGGAHAGAAEFHDEQIGQTQVPLKHQERRRKRLRYITLAVGYFRANNASESRPPPVPASGRWNRDKSHPAPAATAIRCGCGRAGRVRRSARPALRDVRRQFAGAAADALGRIGIQKYFHARVGKNHGADIAAFHHDAARSPRSRAVWRPMPARTAPIAATCEASAEISGVRMASVTSSPLSRTLRCGRSSISAEIASCSSLCASDEAVPLREAHNAMARYMAPVSI